MALGIGRAGGTTVRLVADTRDFNRDIDHAERNFRGASHRMEGDLGRLTRGAAVGSGAFRGFSRSIAFASSAFLGGAGLTAVIKQSIGAASDLNEQMNKVAVVFRGGAAPAVREFAETSAKSFGIAEDAALGMTATFGNMLVPMGFTRTEAAKMSVRLVRLAADMASFNNASPEDVLQALQSALAGQVRPLRQYGVAISSARVEQELLNRHISFTPGHLTAAQKAFATYQIILKDTKDAQGDFARTSDGLANQQRILSAQIKDTEANIGKALLPTVLSVTSAINDWLTKSDNQKRIQADVNRVVKDAGQVLGALRDIFNALTPYVGAATTALGGLKRTVELLVGLAFVAKINGWSTALGLGSSGLAGNAEKATGRLGGLRTSLRNMPASTKIGVTLIIGYEFVTGSAKVLKKLFGLSDVTDQGGDVSGPLGLGEGSAAKEGLGDNGSPYQKGSPLDQVYQAGYKGTGFPARTGHNKAIDRAFKAGITARKSKTGTQVPSSLSGAESLGNLLQGAHHTEGFPGSGQNAVDISAKAGSNVLAPEDGHITRTTGHAPHESGAYNINGYSLYFVATDGSAYFITHLSAVGKKGFYRKGDVIAVVAAHTQGGPHIHVDFSPPISFTHGKSTSSPPSRGIGPGGASGGGTDLNTPVSTKGTTAGAGTSLQIGTGKTYKGERLDDEQKENAALIYDLATSRGLTPAQALQLVAVAYAESGLRTNAINKSSGAFGLFQLLSPGYVKKYNQLRRQGYSPAVANFLAIFSDYKAYFKAHPNAPVGAAGAAVERSGQGASFYARGVGSTFTLGHGGGATHGAAQPKDPISDKLYAQLKVAEIAGDLKKEDTLLTLIIELLNKAIAKAKNAKRKRELLTELQGFLSQRADVRGQIAAGFTTAIEQQVESIRASIAALGEGTFSVTDIIDQATGKVTGHEFAPVTSVRYDPETKKWIVVKVKPTLDAAKKELDYILNTVLPGIDARIASFNGKIKAYAKHPKANRSLIADAKKRRDALIQERTDIVNMATDLAAWISEMEAAMEIPPDKEDTSGGPDTSGAAAAADRPDLTAIPTALRLQGALASDTPGFGDDIGYLRSVESLYTTRLGQQGLSAEDRVSLLEARQGIRSQLASAATSVDLDLQLKQAQARLTPSQLDDREVLKQIEAITEARLKEAKTMEEQIALTNELADLKSQLNEQQGEENAQLIAYLNARRELARTYASNVLGNYMTGSQITIQNFNQPTPQDPHIWSQQVQFELQALVS